MRLLKYATGDDFSLTEFFDEGDLPPYAILSHTWGAEEVTYKDIVNGDCNGKNKDGYKKIRFCARQAALNRLQYFWMDTCCIDKSSSAELHEAINSMFRWYQNATKCYVYLSDVSLPPFSSVTGVPIICEPMLRKSRWFTRGWTLQELIAPAIVEFYSMEERFLGDKSSMAKLIHEITRIPIRAFQGHSLSDFNVQERMSWATHRQTKREEDSVYSLLGIFNVHMPLIYGERKEHARKRLHEEIEKSQKGALIHAATR